MPWMTSVLAFVKKYGKSAKAVASGVMNVVAPGSGSLVALVDLACDRAIDTAQDHFEQSLLDATKHNATELARLGKLFDLLQGDLSGLCATAAGSTSPADAVSRAIAANPDLSAGLHAVEALKNEFDAFKADMRRLADGQDEARPVLVRMNGVADYFDELRAVGVGPGEYADFVRRYLGAAAAVGRGETAGVDAVVAALHRAAPESASIDVLEAAAAAKDRDFRTAQKALTRAVTKRPGDAALRDVTRAVTRHVGGADHDTDRGPKGVTSARLRDGDALDGWRLEKHLGAGGWGQVFKATRGGQTRAVKVMHPELAADAAFVGRFKREIGALMRLPRHPNLVAIDAEGFGYCADRRTWYLVMEYIDGPTLEAHLEQKGPMNEAEVMRVFADAVEGLAAAHAADIVHRDIKPGNFVFRRSDKRLVLVDFGLAVDAGDLGKTTVGGISVMFASPEQHRGGTATKASDVFGLCGVMHYALTYDRPDDRLPDCFDEAAAPASLRDSLVRGLHRNAKYRLADAAELLEAFRAKTPEPLVKSEPPVVRVAAVPKTPKIGDTITNKLGMTFAWVPPGRSWLGGGKGKPGTTEFTLAEGMWCGMYPVTQAEYKAVTGRSPSWYSGFMWGAFGGNPRHPVESVSFNAIEKFLAEINGKTAGDGLLYRLPTEAEWEYICRGGPLSSQEQSAFDFYFARSKDDLTPAPTNDLNGNKANFAGRYQVSSALVGLFLNKPCDVGLYLPNPLGIYDLHGNVSEWTSTQDGSSRVIRGGGYASFGASCAALSRNSCEPSYAFDDLGFRLIGVPCKS